MRKYEKCGKTNNLSIRSKACNNNYYQWNDKKEKRGYMPSFG